MKPAREANKALDVFYEHRQQNIPAFTATLTALFSMLLIIVLLIVMLCSLMTKPAEIKDYSDDQIANAIYLAEGGEKAKVPFGILSVECEGFDACRRVCLNTIRNNRKRYADYGYKDYDTFLEFLWHRYCPPEAHPLNKHWLKNVLYFLEKKNDN